MQSKYFTRKEFACKCGCGYAVVDVELLAVLEDVREHFQEPVTINSACRCDTHNRNVGGISNSKHKLGIASDIVVRDIPVAVVQDYLLNKYPDSLGIGCYETFTHVDVREGKSRWFG